MTPDGPSIDMVMASISLRRMDDSDDEGLYGLKIFVIREKAASCSSVMGNSSSCRLYVLWILLCSLGLRGDTVYGLSLVQVVAT